VYPIALGVEVLHLFVVLFDLTPQMALLDILKGRRAALLPVEHSCNAAEAETDDQDPQPPVLLRHTLIAIVFARPQWKCRRCG